MVSRLTVLLVSVNIVFAPVLKISLILTCINTTIYSFWLKIESDCLPVATLHGSFIGCPFPASESESESEACGSLRNLASKSF